ncbi:hypothetical protein BT96DRAFT_995116 [Gymnopus androsaceus JB14]|uniref:Uncharacterized protein n=1 Tax=Gymnopus androsaceus JB14 TaxID=1447944 RepID=A0A6A4HMC6_9AGAR|nr:hypothetical protein BT96DRAFT_995116 [Gymnopus androsaceus JB14]
MSNAEPSNTPPPQYTPAPAAYIEEFEMKVKKHDPKFTGSKVVDMWRKTTSEAILELIKSGTSPFQNIALTEGQRKNNLNNHYHHKLKKANPRGGIMVSHEDAIKIVDSSDDIQQRVNSGENYQTVVKAMWDKLTEEKRNQWNERGKTGRVGPVEVLVVYSYRDEQQVVQTRHFSVGTSDQDYIAETTGEDQFLKLSVHPFHKWADVALPAVEGGDVFSYNKEGFPLFPDIDLNEMKGKEIQILVDSFLGKIWGKQYNRSEIPWDEIKEHPQSFYDEQEFELPFPLVDPQTILGGKIISLAEYFQEQGSAFRFSKPDQFAHPPRASAPPLPTPVASTSGGERAVTPAAPTPSASTAGNEAAAPTPPVASTSGVERANTPVVPTPSALTARDEAAAPTPPVASTSVVERANTPIVPTPHASTARGEAAAAAPTPPWLQPQELNAPTLPGEAAAAPTLPWLRPQEFNAPTLLLFLAPRALTAEAASPDGPAALTSTTVLESEGRKRGAGAGHPRRSTRGQQTREDKAGSSNEAGPSSTKGAVARKKQSKYWTYVLEPVLGTGPADNMTNDDTSVAPSRKRGRPAKKDVGAGETEDARVKQPPKKKLKRT